ncbi:very-long-chain enoyl-CoA reductase-like [Lissotriton helveticus]
MSCTQIHCGQVKGLNSSLGTLQNKAAMPLIILLPATRRSVQGTAFKLLGLYVIRSHGLNIISYEEDTQLIFSLTEDPSNAETNFCNAMGKVTKWMRDNCLQLSSNKSECISPFSMTNYDFLKALFFQEGKSLKDEDVLQNLPVGTTATLYFKDLGPQVAWTMVFLSEYAGPLFIYYFFYFRLPFVYGQEHAFTSSPHSVVNLSCVCHSLHYVKRLIETVFIHRFSHGTMQLRRMLKNCLYYWGFAAWLAYYINHPLYTPASYGRNQITLALIMFVICETGNFSINVALNRLRTNESKIRRIPHPTKNPFTWLFFFVSCPNYTYEVGTWISYTVMTQCFPVGLFTIICFIQMTIWAKNKHCIYMKQFKDYPTFRMSIIPFFL